jgi:hypothetical protein
LGRDKQQVREIIFLQALLAGHQEAFEQRLREAGVLFMLGGFDLFTGLDFAFVAMPRGNLEHRRDAALPGDAQRTRGISGPSVKEIIPSGLQLPRSHPIHILLLCVIIIRRAKKRKQPDRVPAQRHDIAGRDVLLAIIVTNGPAEEAAIISQEEALVGIQIQPVSANAGVDRIEQGLRFPQAAGSSALRCPPA